MGRLTRADIIPRILGGIFWAFRVGRSPFTGTIRGRLDRLKRPPGSPSLTAAQSIPQNGLAILIRVLLAQGVLRSLHLPEWASRSQTQAGGFLCGVQSPL